MAKRKVKASPAKQSGRTRPVSKQRPAKSGRDSIYQVKITLNGIKPPIWRRVHVKDCTLAELHNVIQTCMGWEDELKAEDYFLEYVRELMKSPNYQGDPFNFQDYLRRDW